MKPSRLIGYHVLCVLLLVLIMVPLWWGFVSSLRPVEDIFRHTTPLSWRALVPVTATVDAYRELFTTQGFGRPLWNTIYVGVWTVLGAILVNGMAGFAFAKYDFPAKRLIFVLVLVTFMIPFEAIAIPLYRVGGQLNMIDTYWALILPAVPNGILVFMFRQFFLEVPHELFEAAQLDGAGPMAVITRIYVPLSKPVLISGSLLAFLAQWQSFLWPLIAVRSERLEVVQVAIASLTLEDRTLWDQLFGASIVGALIPVILLLPLQRYYAQSFLGSGTKG